MPLLVFCSNPETYVAVVVYVKLLKDVCPEYVDVLVMFAVGRIVD